MLLPRLLGRDAGLQATDHIESKASNLCQFAAGEAHRHPQLTAIELPWHEWEFEVARHNTDNFIWLAVEQNFLTDRMRVVMHPAVPHRIADNDYLLAAFVFLPRKRATHQGRDAESGKDTSGKARSIDLCWLIDTGESKAGLLVATEVGERACVTGISVYLGGRNCRRAIRVGSIRDVAEHH
jgi:hypothetical protein